MRRTDLGEENHEFSFVPIEFERVCRHCSREIQGTGGHLDLGWDGQAHGTTPEGTIHTVYSETGAPGYRAAPY